MHRVEIALVIAYSNMLVLISMKRTYIFLLLTLASLTSCLGGGFMCGYSQDQVLSTLGDPIRQISTGRGVLLLYGSVFLELEEDAVVFINAPSFDWLERRRIADAERGIFWGKTTRPAPQPLPPEPVSVDLGRRYAMTSEEHEAWMEQRQRNRERVIETRVRRFLLTRTFRQLMELHPAAQFAANRVDVPAHLYHGFEYRGSVSFLDLKDSRAMRIPAVGERTGFVERHIDFDEKLISSTLAQSRP